MNKKLLVVAVAGALAAPGLALAQASSVTISGKFSVTADQVSYSRASTQTTTAAGIPSVASRLGNSSESRVSDNSSRIIFGIREDLGNGLAAVAQLDQRFNPATQGAPSGTAWAGVTGGGNTWVGLQSTTWGKLTFVSHDLHYGRSGDSWNAAGAGSLQTWGSALFDSIGKPTAATATTAKSSGGHSSLASQSRTRQVIRWEAPNWNGFDGTIAWSANPLTAGGGNASTGGDLGAGLPGAGPNAGQIISRKGQGWNINPRYTASNWNVEYSYWNAKGDVNSAGVAVGNATCINSASACTGATLGGVAVGQGLIQDDQRSDVLAGGIKWNSWTFGLGWNRSKTTSVATGLVTGDRSAWSLPISYTMGPHLFGFVYVKANDSKDIVTSVGSAGGNGYPVIPVGGTISGSDSGAKMFTLNYQYALSKRTALGLTWSQITNSANANYNFFYNSPTAFGSANTGALPGEKIQLVGATVRHNF